MKKFFFIVAILLMTLAMRSQTPFHHEDFASAAGWELDDNWAINSNQLCFTWSPTINNFDLSATSPEIVLPERVQDITFNQYLDVFSTSAYDEFAELYVVKQGEETLLWEYALASGSWGVPGGENLALDLSSFGGDTVQFRIRTYGATTFNWNFWYIYDFTITTLLDYDLSASAISGPKLIDIGEAGTWELEVKNLGTLPQSDFVVKLFHFKTDALLDMIEVSQELLPQQSTTCNLQWTPVNALNTVVYARIESEADDFSINNTSKGLFARVLPDLNFSIMLWDNDNNIATIEDPETAELITPATGLTRALDAAGFDYDTYTWLPDNYESYDIIFATMGCYCLS
jgi:hypothetical protein